MTEQLNGNRDKSIADRLNAVEARFDSIYSSLQKILTRDVFSLAVLAAIVTVISGAFGITIKNSTEKQMDAAVKKADAQLKEIELQAEHSENKSDVLFTKIESDINRKLAELDTKIAIFDDKMKEITSGKVPRVGYLELLSPDGYARNPKTAFVEVGMNRTRETRSGANYAYCYAEAKVYFNGVIEGAPIAKVVSFRNRWSRELAKLFSSKDYNKSTIISEELRRSGWFFSVKDSYVHEETGFRSTIRYTSGPIACDAAEAIVSEALKKETLGEFSIQPYFELDFPTHESRAILVPRPGNFLTLGAIDGYFNDHLKVGGHSEIIEPEENTHNQE